MSMKIKRLKQLNAYVDGQIAQQNVLRDKINEIIDLTEQIEEKVDKIEVALRHRGIKI